MMAQVRVGWAISWATAVGLFAGCAGEDADASCIEQAVSADGHTFNIPFPDQDGVPFSEREIMTVVRVPAGAVAEATSFKLCVLPRESLPESVHIHGVGVEVSPAGHAFRVPVEVKFFLPRGDDPQGVSLLRISREAVDAQLSRWEVLDGLTRTAAPPFLSGELRRTGVFAVHDRPAQVSAADLRVGGKPVRFSGDTHLVAETLDDVPAELDLQLRFENASRKEGTGRISGTLTLVHLDSMRTVSATMADAQIGARADGRVEIGLPERIWVQDSTWPREVGSIELAAGATRALRIVDGNTVVLDFERARTEVAAALAERGFGAVAGAPFFQPSQSYRWSLRCTGSLEIAYRGLASSTIDARGLLNTASPE